MKCTVSLAANAAGVVVLSKRRQTGKAMKFSASWRNTVAGQPARSAVKRANDAAPPYRRG